jgi:tRNA threonylcarbamoyladenosine biosynthesis protein TsaE
MLVVCPDLSALNHLAQAIATVLTPNSVILLQGNLGAGKTTFVRFLGQHLGVQEPITSPTFTIVNEYHGRHLPLYHIDLYRLTSPQHIHALNLPIYWQGVEVTPGITAIEWADKLEELPPAYLDLQFHLGEGQTRMITVQAINGAPCPQNLKP